jgi:hypothetical protein
MNTLPILLLLLIEQCILVLGQHLFLPRHLRIPPIDGFCALAVSSQGGAEGVDYPVNSA